MCAQLGSHARREAEIACVPHHVLTDAGHRERRHAIAVTAIDELDKIGNRLMLIFSTDIYLCGHRGRIEADRIFDIHGHKFVRQFAEDRISATTA